MKNKNWIKNYEEIVTSNLRKDALDIMNMGLNAIDTEEIISKKVKLVKSSLLGGAKGVLNIDGNEYHLDDFNNVKVIGFGKASCKAASVLEKILGSVIEKGIVISKTLTTCEIIETYQGTHPKPSTQNVEASQKIVELIEDLKEDDLVILIVSGGGSSLLCWPYSECDQGQKLFQEFLKTGGTIEELNLLRKHISHLKGGGLAKKLYPATVIGLIFCDIPGDNFSLIASGPTFKDESTMKEAKEIIEKYDLGEYDLVETPKEDKYFKKIRNIPMVSNTDALKAMKEKSEELNYNIKIISSEIYDFADKTFGRLQEESSENNVILAGGEPRMIIPEGKKGSGGRNLFTSMFAINEIKENQVFISLASDGFDNCPIAGAIIDIRTREKLEKSGININEYIENIDAEEFFNKLDESDVSKIKSKIMTGQTEANVSDLLLLIEKK